MLEDSTITVEGMIAEDIPFRSPVDATKISKLDGDFPPRLVEAGVIMIVGDITGIECSVVLSNISVEVGSNEVAGDLVTIKVVFDASVVVGGVKSVMDGRTVGDPVIVEDSIISNEASIDSPVSLTGSLAEVDGTIIEGIADEDGLEYSVIDLNCDIPMIVKAMLVGEVLEYFVVDGVRGIEDSTVT